MQISPLDRSNYLKGLFITARINNVLTEKEKTLIKDVSDKLGFATDFFNETIRTLLSNKYISEEPIQFSDKLIAKSFLTDAIRIAFSDGKIDNFELDWINATAELNGFDKSFVENQLNSIKESLSKSVKFEFALYSII